MTFDLEKAREIAAFMIVHNCYGGERFADTLAEVERLRADLRNCSAYVGIGPGEGDLPIPERVRRTVNRLNGSVHRYEQKILAKDVQIRSLKIEETNLYRQIEQLEAEIERLRGEMENYGDDYVCQMKSKDARIQELEDALVEERAKVIMLIEKLQLVANDPDWQSKGLKHDFDWYLAESKQQIESSEPEDQRCRRLGEPNGWTDPEGEIGPEDVKPRFWQITDERVEALEDAVNRYEVYDCCLELYTMKMRRKGLLKVMLKEAEG